MKLYLGNKNGCIYSVILLQRVVKLTSNRQDVI